MLPTDTYCWVLFLIFFAIFWLTMKEKLGKGGFGLIYSGIDVKTGIQIAIKLVCDFARILTVFDILT